MACRCFSERLLPFILTIWITHTFNPGWSEDWFMEYPVFVYPWLYISTDIQAGLDVEMGIASLGNPQFLSARTADLAICAVEELPRWN